MASSSRHGVTEAIIRLGPNTGRYRAAHHLSRIESFLEAFLLTCLRSNARCWLTYKSLPCVFRSRAQLEPLETEEELVSLGVRFDSCYNG